MRAVDSSWRLSGRFHAGNPIHADGRRKRQLISAATLAGLGLALMPVATLQTASAAEAGPVWLAPITVTATRVELDAVQAPYVSEVHTRADIENSGATSLYDYLSRFTSVQVLPSFGNRAAPSLAIRGYGIENGHQNLVVAVDGRRLRNIDLRPPLIGGIPLATIDRIEITKGSGSVLLGDGAMSGTIQIFTRPRDGLDIEGYAGNRGQRGGHFGYGLSGARYALSGLVDGQQNDGFSDPGPDGIRDRSSTEVWQARLEFLPVEALRIDLTLDRTDVDTRYPNALTLEQFQDNPAQNTGLSYTRQETLNDHVGLAVTADGDHAGQFHLRHDRDDQEAANTFFWSPEPFGFDYRQSATELSWEGSWQQAVVTAGLQYDEGSRHATDNRTDKDHLGAFAQWVRQTPTTTYLLGARVERVRYAYRPSEGDVLRSDRDLTAMDIGINHRWNETVWLIANFNTAFQAPDIDRFFLFGGGFNEFIDPARSRTVNAGLNHQTARSRLQLTGYHSWVRDEIYMIPFTFENTNLDKSRKYGIELLHTFRWSEWVSTQMNYAWTKARIDSVKPGQAGLVGQEAFAGSDLPGVPEHSVVLGANLKTSPAGRLNLSHTWRSEAWAAEDFGNEFTQKQRSYQSTDLNYVHDFRNFSLFAGVGNLFQRKNGFWLRDDVIYPVDFTRTWQLGARAAF